MKSEGKLKQWTVLLLCVLIAVSALAQTAAAYDGVATGKCTNIANEGIEYFIPVSILAAEANDWRTDLNLTVEGDAGADIKGMEIEVTTDSTRYQCTEIAPADYSCNSIPTNAVINGIYILYSPSVSQDKYVTFVISQATSGKELLRANAQVKYPPAPCSRNDLLKDFIAADDEALVYNTSKECTEHQEVDFVEQDPPFTIVNIIPGDKIVGKRIIIDVSPKVTFDYKLTLTFWNYEDPATIYDVTYTYTASDPDNPVIDASALDELKLSDLPVHLVEGKITDVSTTEKDIWGNDSYPTDVNFDIKFYYENNTGTLGFENSIFHFEREMHVKFAPYCNGDYQNQVITGVASALYDPCQTSKQMFSVSLKDGNGQGIVVPKTQADKELCDSSADVTCIPCDDVSYCTDIYSIKPMVHDYSIDHKAPAEGNYYFVVRKCRNSSCTNLATTDSYLYSLTFADAQSQSRTYRDSATKYSGVQHFKIRAYDDTGKERPFAITGARFVADGPGTYVVFGFVDPSLIAKGDLRHYGVKFYITVNQTNDLGTCSTLANNGYFRAYWNDCLSHKEPQLMKFEHIPGTEEAWVTNRSNHGIHFPYIAEWSYLPQKLQVGSLDCKFEPLSSSGRPADGYCTPEDVYVPPYTKVTITGGTIYLDERPGFDEYRVAYMREDTLNISHLIMTVTIKECENVRQIPNTGITLPSPLRVRESVDAATTYTFTGNSLRIPAIGLGMEIPIPIVHVDYYENSADMDWDLSTLGDYVGELEGGAYLPYPGNAALTGHNYSGGIFRNLERLNYEDEIIVFGNDGIKYTYKVAQKFIANPADVYEMFQPLGERSLTLVTCENFNQNTNKYERRYLIRAYLESMEPYEKNW